MGAGYVSAWQAALTQSQHAVEIRFFSLFRYPLNQGVKDIGVKPVIRLRPEMVGKTDKNDAARHGFDMAFIPVSDGAFCVCPSG
jgi:hypothetical protein